MGKSKNGLPKFGAARERAQGLSMRVRREQKAAAEAARFGAHFTRIVRYSVLGCNKFRLVRGRGYIEPPFKANQLQQAFMSVRLMQH